MLLRRSAAALCAPRANAFRCRRICTPATPGAPVPTLSPAQKQYALVLKSRDAERKRFGMPVLHLLAAGFVGVVLALEWWTERIIPPESLSPSLLSLPASSPVISQVQACALLSDVRRVLDRHGIGLGPTRIDVRLEPGLHLSGVEGLTLKEHGARRRRNRHSMDGRRVEAIVLQPGMKALHASHVLAHEFMHTWLWLQGAPPLRRCC